MFYRIREHQTGPVDYTATDPQRPPIRGSPERAPPGDKVLDVVGTSGTPGRRRLFRRSA